MLVAWYSAGYARSRPCQWLALIADAAKGGPPTGR